MSVELLVLYPTSTDPEEFIGGMVFDNALRPIASAPLRASASR